MTQNAGNQGKPPPETGIKHLLRSCKYSWEGCKAACTEAAFRQELAAGVILIPAAWLLPVSLMTSIFLTICWLQLLITELLNTAVESVTDMASPDFHILAKRAKDIASFAVTCAIAVNAIAWAGTIYNVIKICGKSS